MVVDVELAVHVALVDGPMFALELPQAAVRPATAANAMAAAALLGAPLLLTPSRGGPTLQFTF